MANWTNAQADAIAVRNRTLLVSAGAGSGKTTVLTQRLLERILAGASVTDFLVVTFTNASAADLREKLYRELSRIASEHPENRHFRKQLYLLPEASIGTIHSFCGQMVRSHFQLLGLSPRLRVADEQEAKLMQIDAMTEAIEEGYASGDEEFLFMADTFTGMKDDGPLLETMLSVYSRLRAFSNGDEWLRAAGESMLADAEEMRNGLFETGTGKKLQAFLVSRLQGVEKEFSMLISYAEERGSKESVLSILREWQDHVRSLVSCAERGQQAFLDESRNWSMTKKMIGADSAVSHIRKELKEELDGLEKLFSLSDPGILADQFRKTGRVLLTVRSFLDGFERKYGALKKERGRMDFEDAEHLFLSLLERDGVETEVCRVLRSRFQEIFIDEYQDVSPLQDRIFSLLSNGRNRFMVGDVKQSIYRFRNAFPDIFLSYKERFPDVRRPDGTLLPENPDAAEEGGRIFLRENFRSGAHVLSFTNLLFRSLTEATEYAREYEGEELICARENRDDPLPVTVAYAAYDGSRNSIYRDKDARKAEAAYVADKIARIMETAEWTERDGNVRKCRYGDFALLFSALKGKTKDYEDALRARGIPFSVTVDQPFFEQPEIRLALSVLRAVDDPTDDVSLFGMMRSPLFGFTADEIYALRKESPGPSLLASVRAAAENGGETGVKCAAFLDRLEEFRSLAEGRACHVFLWELYARTGLLYIGSGRTRNHLLMLYENARSFESSGYKGLSGFLSYLRVAEEKGIVLPAGAESSGEDRVILTTIHKSKGLEYPVVFLCDAGRTVNKGANAPFRILRDAGMFFPLRDMERMTKTDPLLFRFAKEQEQANEFGETLRKLYVGCTRAREKLFVTGVMSQQKLDSRQFIRRNPSTVLELILYAADRNSGDPSFVTESIPACAAAVPEVPSEAPEIEKDPGSFRGLTDAEREALTFEYPFRTGYPAKITASELKKRGGLLVSETRESQLVRDPEFLSGVSKDRDPAHGGTANHAFLQHCDYGLVERKGVLAEADRLVRERFLTQTQRELLDLDALQLFFRSDLYRRIRRSPRVEREQPFSVLVSAGLVGGDPDEQVVLQGLIDCVFEDEDGKLTVLDYKTDRVPGAKTLADRYHLQLLCYRLAVREMTGEEVGRTLLWSFTLDREVEVDLSKYGDLPF